ncbi:MAG: tRNA pseudouridine(55) synthase TruB [Desulfuromonas sp.]|uniref:tRNA pseudouridine(55) synthase TruB n=1 Tax=Desulfuromonas sp. TaxID=892 RepID=UPI000CAF2370|nr:tRNA pseudouridine(55) synthase TruB [Desulfuromonas sp.]PLX84749.1 MAG: tRNA pseudouridine(55) synthase TruB [Desulfuromonas sp.]
MHGLLVIDKPRGLSSHDVVRQVRRVLKTRKVGHGGTLDPLATGVLPVAVGEGTRILQFLLEGDKAYRATFKLGEVTSTQDSDGELVESRPLDGVTQEAVGKACRRLVGTISQVPPMYSALKHNGVPLYRLARQGVEVERKARQVEIHQLDLVEVDLPFVTIEVTCSKGTYVRTLVHDIGADLGCGAHLTALRRIQSGPFSESDSVPLGEIQDWEPGEAEGKLLDLSEALRQYPGLEVDGAAAERLRHGIPPSLEEAVGPFPGEEGNMVRLLQGGVLMAIAHFAPCRKREKRGDFELIKVLNLPPVS